MDLFELFDKLPSELKVIHRKKVYHMVPVLFRSGSRFLFGYEGQGRYLGFWNRIEDWEELERFLLNTAEELHGVEVYHTKRLFDLKEIREVN